jgi:hypothetical protein
MPLIQKLTGKAYQNILRRLHNLDLSYDFEKDPQGVKTRRSRKNLVRILTDKNAEGHTYLEEYLYNNDNAYRLYTQEIPDAINEIDGGRNILSVKLNFNQQTNVPSLDIKDLSLTIAGPVIKKFTKEEVGKYLQPRTVFVKKKY